LYLLSTDVIGWTFATRTSFRLIDTTPGTGS
jgi:hypothetical protein